MWLTSTGGSPPPSSSLLQDTRPYHDNGFYNVTPATTTDFPLGENSTVQLFTHSRHPNLLPNAPSHQGGASGGGSTPLEDKLTQLVVSGVSGGGGLVHPGGDSVYFYHNLSSSRAHPGAVVEQPLGGALENAFNTVTLDTYYYNDSSWFNVTPTEEEPLEDEYNWGVLSLSLLILATMVGNVLVCLAVCWEKRLQNMTNYFLMSLAIADLLVSMLVMPLGMVVEFFGKAKNLFIIIAFLITASYHIMLFLLYYSILSFLNTPLPIQPYHVIMYSITLTIFTRCHPFSYYR